MKKIVVVVPGSHAWLWPQTCLATLAKYPPKAEGFEVDIIYVDNSWDWSPSKMGVRLMQERMPDLVYMENSKHNKFHASALDEVVDYLDFDYMMALETDVVALHPDWLQWFVNQIEESSERFAVGHWHHEQFVNPSCTIYRGDVLRKMNDWCKANKSEEQRWGSSFEKHMKLNPGDIDWVNGPFADKRGWPEGTVLNSKPSGQEKGFGWYEPGQMLHHWAVNEGYNYMVCNTAHTEVDGCPVHTIYGQSQQNAPQVSLELEQLWHTGYAAHLWGGTRALDIIKHDVTDQFVKSHISQWCQREARFWKQAVPEEIQEQTIELIRQYGWHTKGLGTPETTDRDRAAGKQAEAEYAKAGVII
jgi:hypothetical protein